MLTNYFQKVLSILLDSKKTLIAFGSILVLLIVLTIVDYSFLSNFTNTTYGGYYKVFNVRIPKDLVFANEKVPVEERKVREAVAKEITKNTYWQSQSSVLHKRAFQWFIVIDPILKKNNIPEDFRYIALVESQLTNVVSPKGATGFWQFIESTGKGYGLEISPTVDERYNVVKSTEAACKYFKEAYKQLNNWTLVAAAYNCGIAGLQNQLKKQKTTNYYNLDMSNETDTYLYKIIAMKELISNPKIYGLKLKKKDLMNYEHTNKIIVDSTINNLSTFALSNGIDYNTLVHFNPWLKANQLPNSDKKKYVIEIPKNKNKMYEGEVINYLKEKMLIKADSAKLDLQ